MLRVGVVVVGTYVDDSALTEGRPVIVGDEVLDLVAGTLGKVAHGETEDLGAIGTIGQELEDGLAIEGKGETGVALLAAVGVLDNLLDGVDGSGSPLLEGHVEPVADAGALEQGLGSSSVGNDTGRNLLEDVVDGSVTDESHDKRLLEANLLGDLGECGSAVEGNGIMDTPVHYGVERDVVVVLVPCLPPQVLSRAEGEDLKILSSLEEPNAGSLKVVICRWDGELARGADLEAGKGKVVAFDVVGELLSLSRGDGREFGKSRHFVYGYNKNEM